MISLVYIDNYTCLDCPPVVQFAYTTQHIIGMDSFISIVIQAPVKTLHLFPFDCPKAMYHSYMNSLRLVGITVLVYGRVTRLDEMSEVANSLWSRATTTTDDAEGTHLW